MLYFEYQVLSNLDNSKSRFLKLTKHLILNLFFFFPKAGVSKLTQQLHLIYMKLQKVDVNSIL